MLFITCLFLAEAHFVYSRNSSCYSTNCISKSSPGVISANLCQEHDLASGNFTQLFLPDHWPTFCLTIVLRIDNVPHPTGPKFPPYTLVTIVERRAFVPEGPGSRQPSGCLALCHYASLMNLVPDSHFVARPHTLLYFGCHRHSLANNEDLRPLWRKQSTRSPGFLNGTDQFDCGRAYGFEVCPMQEELKPDRFLPEIAPRTYSPEWNGALGWPGERDRYWWWLIFSEIAATYWILCYWWKMGVR